MPDPFVYYPHPIKLVLSDLDGTITSDELRLIDCDGLRFLRRFNDRSRTERVVPPLSVVTGRPHSYVEAFCRFLGTPLPSLFESGCGIHLPDKPLGREYLFHPALADPAVRDAGARFRAWADEELVAKRGAGFIIGKQYALSYAPGDGSSVDELLAAMRAMPADLASRFFITRSSAVVDITPRPVDKGTGFEWLLSYLRAKLGFDIAPANVVGVGDSFNDLPILGKVGIPCAVANAAPAIKEKTRYVAQGASAEGVAEVMEQAVVLNERLGYV